MKREGFLGVDLGGTSVKAGVFDRAGKLLGFGRATYTPAIDAEGHVELPIGEIREATRGAITCAIRESQASVLSLAISSQGQSFVSLDAADHPLHPVILWYDSRAARQAEQMREAVLARCPERPPDWIDAIAVAPKIMWLRERYPAIMARARRFLLLPDYFAYQLTGRAATDPITARTTALVGGGDEYSAQRLDVASISVDQLAEVQAPCTPIGRVSAVAAAEWGLPPDTLVVTGTNDQYAGSLGAGNCQPGIVTETTGTCLAVLTLTEHSPDLLPTAFLTGRYPIAAYQYVLSYLKTAGVVLEWFGRELAGNLHARELDELARQVPAGSNGVIVVPHFEGMTSPHGVIADLRLQHTQADICRAIMESVAFSLRETLEAFLNCGFGVDCIRSIGGGARSDFWLQMKADVTGRVIERPAVTEAAVLGAALMAEVGYGQFSTLAEASSACYRPANCYAPDKPTQRSYEDLYQRYSRLCKSFAPFHS